MREMKDSGVPWIGEIPKGWELQRGKNILTLLERPVLDDDGVITCFRDGEVTLRSNRREDGFTFSIQEAGYQGIEPGDLVVHGMDGFAGAIGISDSRGKATPVLNVLDSSQSKRYLMYQMRTMAHCGLFFALSSGIRVRSCDTNWNKLKVINYIIPSLSEQRRIADFLDSKCAEIDSILEQTKESIEEYKKLKQSVITEAVTKGIRGERPMKDSGVEWIGETPADWEVYPLKHLFVRRSQKNNPIVSTERLSLSIDVGITKYADKTTNLDRFKDDFSQYQLAYPDDIVLNSMNMIVGAVGKSPFFGCVSPVYYVIYPRSSADVRYWSYLLNCMKIRDVYHSLGQGIYAIERGEGRVNTCRLKVPYDDFGRIMVSTPSYEEQQEIAAYLDEKCAAIDSLIASKEALITELEAYKKSLIYEYVTGKKEVV